MEFDITHLDKVLLIQTLYFHANPKGYGEREYDEMLQKGKAVEGLSKNECESILRGYNAKGYLVDYYNGKPLKLHWRKTRNGKLLMLSLPYDSIHGRFRFLEALLNVFGPEEIIITQIKYDPIQEEFFKRENDPRIVEYELAQLLRHAIAYPGDTEMGKHWKIDQDNFAYRSAFLQGLDT